jgi:Zn-dependent peptidase ImmA (M78 family)
MIDKLDLLLKSQETRQKIGEDVSSPIDIFALASTINKLTIVRCPMNDHLSGMCIKAKDCKVIAINSAMSLGRQRFSLAHELYHLFYDKNLTAICLKGNSENEVERKADIFAAYLLVPPTSLKNKIQQFKEEYLIDLKVVIKLEQYFGVSHQAMLNQLVDINQITSMQALEMHNGVIKEAKLLGYSTELYEKSPKNKQYQTTGYLIKQASEALEREMISEGKYEEILLQAFRSDIVYGCDEEGELID